MDMTQFATKQDVEDIVTRVVKAGFQEFGVVLSDALQMISDRFDKVDERFRSIDERFDGIDKRLDRMDKRFDEIETVMMRMDNKLNDSLARLDDHDAKIGMIQRKIA